MNDSKITKKRHPSGSLTRRVSIIAIFLLVIPLFLQSFFLYRQEYIQKLNDIEEELAILASERARFVEEMILTNWAILTQTSVGDAPQGKNVKRLYIERISLPPNAGEKFIAISKRRQALLAAVTDTKTSALAIPISFATIGKDIPKTYPVQIALVGSTGQIFWDSGELKTKDPLQAEDPIGETGLLIRLSVDKDQIKALHLRSYYFRFASLVFFVGLIGGGAVFWLTRRVARPLRRLCKVMERVKEGAAHVRYSPDWLGFEINGLGLQFNETLDGLLQHANEAEKEKLHRERLAQEFHIGHEIQMSLLPKHVPGFSGVDLATSYLAAKEVNGDFYDLFKLSNGKLLIAICDTAGKGISACLFALGLRSMIRSLASVETDLSSLVRRANDLYSIDAQESSMFSTLWIGIYDPKEKTLTYCSQGHPPALLIRGAQLEELWTEGIALGAQKMDKIPTQEIDLQAGDLLVLYTDGIIEAHNPKHELFGKERFYELFMHKQKATAQQNIDRVMEEIKLFASGAPQHDDITLLIMHVQK